MTLRISTNNSVYELDLDNNRVRRVRGSNPPTQNFREDGLWHRITAADMVMGCYVFTFLDPEKTWTMTSPVVSEEEV